MFGIIGGSGLYDLPGVELIERVLPDTPYGFPSDEIAIGRIAGRIWLPHLPRLKRGREPFRKQAGNRKS